MLSFLKFNRTKNDRLREPYCGSVSLLLSLLPLSSHKTVWGRSVWGTSLKNNSLLGSLLASSTNLNRIQQLKFECKLEFLPVIWPTIMIPKAVTESNQMFSVFIAELLVQHSGTAFFGCSDWYGCFQVNGSSCLNQYPVQAYGVS